MESEFCVHENSFMKTSQNWTVSPIVSRKSIARKPADRSVSCEQGKLYACLRYHHVARSTLEPHIKALRKTVRSSHSQLLANDRETFALIMNHVDEHINPPVATTMLANITVKNGLRN